MRIDTAFRAALLAVAMGLALHHAAPGGEFGGCCDYRPLWIPPSQPIPPCATHTGGPYTLNLLRFAHGTPACFCLPRFCLPKLSAPWSCPAHGLPSPATPCHECAGEEPAIISEGAMPVPAAQP